ncbi:MAG: hypothetical protein J0I41_14985 [Filimonas sp.]|nr:hypothetical protein [Filimonas sp.]
MKNKITILLLATVVLLLSAAQFSRSSNRLHAQTKKTTDAYVSFDVSENSLNSSFHYWLSVSEPLCEDITVDGSFTVNNGRHSFTYTIPAGQTQVQFEEGGCPPAFSAEGMRVDNVSTNNACGTNIYW